MTKTEALKDPFANFCMSVWSVATRFGRAISDLACDYSRARQAAALAEADHKHPARIKTLFV